MLGCDVFFQPLALIELLPPDAKTFPQSGSLRMGGAKVVELLMFALYLLKLLLCLFSNPGGRCRS